MLAPRVWLLSVFAGGCLSGGIVVAFLSRGAEVPSARGATPPRLERRPVVEPGPSSANAELAPEAPAPPLATTHTQTTHAEPADSDGPSVADVLSRLESAYRAQLAAEATSKAPDPVAPLAVAEPEPVAAEPVVAAPAEPVATPAAVVASKAEPQSETARPEAPAASREAPAPTVVHTGEVNRSVQIGTLVQGNVYQFQELAYLQYLQLLTLSSPQTWVVASPQSPPVHLRPVHRGHFGYRPLTRRKPAFPDSITNPDNPWGFDFPPPMLAK